MSGNKQNENESEALLDLIDELQLVEITSSRLNDVDQAIEVNIGDL